MTIPSVKPISGTPQQTRFLTPFDPKSLSTVTSFWRGAKHKQRNMIFAVTRPEFWDAFIAHVQAGLDIKTIVDATEAGNQYEHPQIIRAQKAGAKDGQHFVIGTSPDARTFLHIKASWNDNRHVMDGSLNWSNSGLKEVNTVSITDWPEWAQTLDTVFDYTWAWILKHEQKYQIGGKKK